MESLKIGEAVTTPGGPGVIVGFPPAAEAKGIVGLVEVEHEGGVPGFYHIMELEAV